MQLIRNNKGIRILSSQILSGVATWCVTLGIQMTIIFNYNANILGVSILYSAALLPKIIFPVFIGSYLDRVKSRVAIVKLGRLIAAIVAIICFLCKNATEMIVCVFVLNSALSTEDPGMIGVIRNLKGKKDDFDLLGIYYMLADVIKIIGPAVAAGIAFFATNKNLFFVATFLFVLSILLLKVEENEKSQISEHLQKSHKNMSAIVRTILHTNELLYIFVIVFAFLFSLNAIDTSSGILIRTFTRQSYIQAVFVSLMGIGGTLGSVFVLKLMKKINLLTINLVSMCFFGILLCFVVLVHNIQDLLAIVFIAGLLAPGVIMSAEIRRQQIVTKEKASALSGISITVNSFAQFFGIIASPIIAGFLSASGVFLICGVLMICIAFLGSIKRWKTDHL